MENFVETKNQDHPNHSISKNTEKSSGVLRKLAVS